MYRLINEFAEEVVGRIPSGFLPNYERLIENIEEAQKPTYQKEYRRFWAMNAAQLSPEFYRVYFQLLRDSRKKAQSLENVIEALYRASERRNGDRSVQFSFATKLVHMANPQYPIYDSRVAEFYFFRPRGSQRFQERVDRLLEFHAFLCQEYARVLERGLLAIAIQGFRSRFRPRQITDEKIVDSLIWAFVTMLNEGRLIDKAVAYS